jgi:hypothetical protein
MPDRDLLRHTLATLAYRCNKTLRDAPETFAEFRTPEIVNTPLDLMSHMADLLEWALTACKGSMTYNHSTPTSWQHEVKRFHKAIESLDDYLGSSEVLHANLARLFQGPIADALTHTGQLALLRRMAGSAIRGENYFVAKIEIGKVGKE